MRRYFGILALASISLTFGNSAQAGKGGGGNHANSGGNSTLNSNHSYQAHLNSAVANLNAKTLGKVTGSQNGTGFIADPRPLKATGGNVVTGNKNGVGFIADPTHGAAVTQPKPSSYYQSLSATPMSFMSTTPSTGTTGPVVRDHSVPKLGQGTTATNIPGHVRDNAIVGTGWGLSLPDTGFQAQNLTRNSATGIGDHRNDSNDNRVNQTGWTSNSTGPANSMPQVPQPTGGMRGRH